MTDLCCGLWECYDNKPILEKKEKKCIFHMDQSIYMKNASPKVGGRSVDDPAHVTK